MTPEDSPPKTLADLLAVDDPRPEVPPVQEHTPYPTAKAWARAILNSPEYRAALLRKILFDDLAPAMDMRLWEYAYGKPVERVEVKMPETLDGVKMDEITRRVQTLQETIRMLTMKQGLDPALSDDDEPSSVH